MTRKKLKSRTPNNIEALESAIKAHPQHDVQFFCSYHKLYFNASRKETEEIISCFEKHFITAGQWNNNCDSISKENFGILLHCMLSLFASTPTVENAARVLLFLVHERVKCLPQEVVELLQKNNNEKYKQLLQATKSLEDKATIIHAISTKGKIPPYIVLDGQDDIHALKEVMMEAFHYEHKCMKDMVAKQLYLAVKSHLMPGTTTTSLLHSVENLFSKDGSFWLRCIGLVGDAEILQLVQEAFERLNETTKQFFYQNVTAWIIDLVTNDKETLQLLSLDNFKAILRFVAFVKDRGLKYSTFQKIWSKTLDLFQAPYSLLNQLSNSQRNNYHYFAKAFEGSLAHMATGLLLQLQGHSGLYSCLLKQDITYDEFVALEVAGQGFKNKSNVRVCCRYVPTSFMYSYLVGSNDKDMVDSINRLYQPIVQTIREEGDRIQQRISTLSQYTNPVVVKHEYLTKIMHRIGMNLSSVSPKLKWLYSELKLAKMQDAKMEQANKSALVYKFIGDTLYSFTEFNSYALTAQEQSLMVRIVTPILLLFQPPNFSDSGLPGFYNTWWQATKSSFIDLVDKELSYTNDWHLRLNSSLKVAKFRDVVIYFGNNT